MDESAAVVGLLFLTVVLPWIPAMFVLDSKSQTMKANKNVDIFTDFLNLVKQ